MTVNNYVVGYSGSKFIIQSLRGVVDDATLTWPIKLVDPNVIADKLYKQLVAKGGFTYSIANGFATQGYAVAIDDKFEDIYWDYEITPEVIKNYIIAHAKDLVAIPNSCVGAWVDSTDEVYLDISQVVATEDEATELGKANGQIAVFDLAGGKEIRL